MKSLFHISHLYFSKLCVRLCVCVCVCVCVSVRVSIVFVCIFVRLFKNLAYCEFWIPPGQWKISQNLLWLFSSSDGWSLLHKFYFKITETLKWGYFPAPNKAPSLMQLEFYICKHRNYIYRIKCFCNWLYTLERTYIISQIIDEALTFS